MEIAALFIGIAIGCLVGLSFVWWLSRSKGAGEPIFLRLLRRERRVAANLDTRLMLHELLRKVEELNLKTQRMDEELQELRSVVPDTGRVETDGVSGKPISFPEVYRLSSRGFTAEEITGRLQLGRGEVELLLSLGKKPPWVVGNPQDKIGRGEQIRVKRPT